MPLVTGHDGAVADWVAARLGIAIAPPYVALGVLNDTGTLIGGAVFSGRSGANIDVTIYGPGAMTRPALRAGFAYVFGQLRCERLTARCKRSNVAMRRLMERLGFTYEGTQRRYWGPERSDDAMLYGMTRDECRWLPTRASSLPCSATRHPRAASGPIVSSRSRRPGTAASTPQNSSR